MKEMKEMKERDRGMDQQQALARGITPAQWEQAITHPWAWVLFPAFRLRAIPGDGVEWQAYRNEGQQAVIIFEDQWRQR